MSALLARLLVVTLAIAGLGGCSFLHQPKPPDVAFPRHTIEPGDGAPAALLTGTLVLEGRCLLLQSGAASYLAIWPPGWSVDRLVDGRVGVVAPARGMIATVDARVEAVGGTVADDSPAYTGETRAAAAVCPGHPWWLMADLRSASG